MQIQINAYNMSYSWAFEEASIKNPMTLTFSLSLLCALGVEHGRINWKLGQWFSHFLAPGPLHTITNYWKP